MQLCPILNGSFRALFALVVMAGGVEAQPKVVAYVDVHATGPVHNGTSWCSAFLDLSEVLDQAFDGVEIRVANGTYRPDPTGIADPRKATFRLEPGVKIAGGFAGCGGDHPDARDISGFKTTLSGDLNRDDSTGGDNSDNCYHVVSASNSGIATRYPSVIEGFTITGGNANGPRLVPASNAWGGGLLSIGEITISECIIERNSATFGGGMLSLPGSPLISKTIFRNNTAKWMGGLVIYEDFASSLGNAGVSTATPTVHGNPRIVECLFEENRAANSGGAVWIQGHLLNPTFLDTVFSHNHAQVEGGAVVLLGTEHVFNNCLFVENESGIAGGAALIQAATTFTNCSLVYNRSEAGGAIQTDAGVPVYLRDSLLWGNHAGAATDELAHFGGQSPMVDHTTVQGWTGVWGGPGNDGLDPLFVPGPQGCFYLSQTLAEQPHQSPSVDTGSRQSIAAGLHLRSTRWDEVGDVEVVDRGYHFQVTGAPFLMGDDDTDGSRTLRDVARFQVCYSGDREADVASCCRVFDFDWDRKVDLSDLSELVAVLAVP